jgi:hypothetical protein
LAAGADESAFVASDARFQCEVAYQQPGIARRTLARGANGAWLVETLWWTVEHADAAVHVDDDLASFIDETSIVVTRWDEDFPR